MSWSASRVKESLRDTISSLLGAEPKAPSPQALEPVRQALLDALGEDGGKLNPVLKRRIQYVGDASALWYIRPDLVAVLSQLHGEARAVETIQSLSPVFKGLVPDALMAPQKPMR